MAGLGAGLAEGKLILVSCIRETIPSACPSSKVTTRRESRSILLPTMMQLTFWLMDLSQSTVLAHFVIPVGYVFEALSVGDIIYNDDAVGVTIIAVGDGSKSLLPSCIPLREGRGTRTSLAF